MNNSISILEIKKYIEFKIQKKLSIEEIIDFLEKAINISDLQFYHQKTKETSSKDIFEQFISQISKEEIIGIYNYIKSENEKKQVLQKVKHH